MIGGAERGSLTAVPNGETSDVVGREDRDPAHGALDRAAKAAPLQQPGGDAETTEG